MDRAHSTSPFPTPNPLLICNGRAAHADDIGLDVAPVYVGQVHRLGEPSLGGDRRRANIHGIGRMPANATSVPVRSFPRSVIARERLVLP